MQINEVSKATALPISTLRYYERKKLIPDLFLQRDGNNYRIYTPEIIDYLEDVKTLLSVGFTVEELSQMVAPQFPLDRTTKKTMIEHKIKEIEGIQKRLKKSKQFLQDILEGKAHFQIRC
jgi:DNA-binding transcriptional MerR regulator